MKNIRTFGQLFSQLMHILNRKQQRQFGLLIAGTIFVGMLEVLGVSAIIPFVLVMLSPEQFMQNSYVQYLTGMLGISEYRQILLLVAAGIILVYIVKEVMIILINYFQCQFRNRLERDLSNSMLEHYLHQNYLFHVNTNSSEIVRSVHSDVSGVASVVDAFSNLSCEMFSTALIGLFLISVNPVMAVILLMLSGLTSLGIIVVFKKKINTSGVECRNAYQKKIQYIQQAENGIKDIIVKQKYEYFMNCFRQYSQEACHHNTVYLTIAKMPNRIVEVIFIAGLLIAAVFCTGDGENASMFVTQLGVFGVAATRILPSISNIAVYMNNLIYFRPTVEAIYESGKNREGEQYAVAKTADEKIPFRNQICIRNVSWKYAENADYVLENVSLDIRRGEAVALIGVSGSGKTTLADIILGLLKPVQGHITVDGRDIHEDASIWSQMVGYVPQSLFLLDDTIRNNIAFGVPEEEIEEDRIRMALEEAQLKEMVEQLPDGLDTNLGEQGLKISGGQRQRIAIARALYFDPDILVLDEATSALDAEVESAVMESVDALHGRKTLIIVAHRLSTIRKCDKIYEVADKGLVLKSREEVFGEG